MFRLWGKVIHENHLINDYVAENDEEDTRTHKVFKCIDQICDKLELQRPVWLDNNVRDFQKFSFVRFTQDNFIDSIEFDYLEIRIIEED